jgi:transposase
MTMSSQRLPAARWRAGAARAGAPAASALPADFPPPGTVYWQAAKWETAGSTARMHDDLRERVRLAAGRKAAPTAAVIDSQSVKGSEMISRARRGYDAGKKINGTKRHIAAGTTGLLLTVVITAASVQDRDAAKPLLWNLRRAFPQITLVWADGGYAGKLVNWAKASLRLTLEIVKRPDDLHVFKVLPRRWVVERTLSWITRHRRTVRDYERLPTRHETYIYWSMIIVMTRRLARIPPPNQALPEFSAGSKTEQAARAGRQPDDHRRCQAIEGPPPSASFREAELRVTGPGRLRDPQHSRRAAGALGRYRAHQPDPSPDPAGRGRRGRGRLKDSSHGHHDGFTCPASPACALMPSAPAARTAG